MKFTSSLFLIAHMAAGALALSGDGAACQLNIDCLSGYCMPHQGSDKYVCWGERRKGGQYHLDSFCRLHMCNKGLTCKSYQGSWFLGKCT
ncbi:hypothetical protein FCIRC_10139 [Fusarium circinatum]|uniref:Uncharacterized protein n=1 Tax=Fusarium circinatum TaxID=48490 RepID=A0A8H5T8H4_FUSCI|nr:hypothetical protein FCIRC_10139 [Fusarium circinatum]